jgi:tyrosinase
MRANESLVLSLLSTAAVALPSPSPTSTGKSCKVGHGHKQAAHHQDHHVAELKAQVSSLRKQISSVYAEPSRAACKATSSASGSVPFTAAMSTGAASATMPAAYETFFSSIGSMSRLVPTAGQTYAAGSDAAPAPTGGMDASKGGEAPSSYAAGASGASSDAPAPYPTMSTYTNGTIVGHHATGASSVASGSSTSAPLLSTGVSSSASSTSTGVSPTYIPKLSDFTAAEISSGEAWKNVSQIADQRMKARDLEGSCTYENAAVRTEFRAMSNEKRKEFTDAVTCLKNMPPTMTADQAAEFPGVKSRYDEYVAQHIENTFKIHATADFLAWHRHFIFTFEQDLKNSCGYTGTLPYWDWAADAQAVDRSEIFNGDEYSMGGNGEYIAGRADTYLGLQDLNFPPGTGGGCVTKGPFSNETYTTNLGPIDSPYNNNVVGQYDYNPRCLVRDLNSWFSQRYNTYNNVADLAIGVDSVEYLQSLMQGYLGDNKLGVHGGGHWLGGGPSQLEDFHSSPNDPIFYIHHAMIDKIWTVWQYMDRENRQNAIYGTSTLNNSPASPDMTLADELPFGLVTANPVFGDLMDTLAGPYCYRYE